MLQVQEDCKSAGTLVWVRGTKKQVLEVNGSRCVLRYPELLKRWLLERGGAVGRSQDVVQNWSHDLLRWRDGRISFAERRMETLAPVEYEHHVKYNHSEFQIMLIILQ